MCILMVADRGATPKLEELEQGACRNPHGFGFAIIANGKIISERTMKAERSIERFLKFREEYPDEIAIWHARIATHGGKNEANCHPFRVGGDDRTYLAHNGVLRVPMAHDEHRSDSRVFADEVLPALGGVTALDNPYKHLMIEGWASGSKIAVLTVDPEAKAQCYIINEDAGKWDNNNVWWSNQTHIAPKAYSYSAKDYDNDYGSSTYKPKAAGFYLAHSWDFEKKEYTLKEGWYMTALGEYEMEKADIVLGAPMLALVPPLPADEEDDVVVEEDDEWVINCPICDRETDTAFDPDYCTKCHVCFGCGQKRLLCMCYNGSEWSGHFGY